MAADQDEALSAAFERLMAGQAAGDDLPRLKQAVADGRITLAGGSSQAVSQSGGVNFGQSNQIQISGSAIGSMTLNLSDAVEAAQLLDLLQPFQPEPPPPQELLPEPGDLPPGSRLPFPRNAIFTGREDDLKALAASLLHAGQPAAATGTGGIGKTQLSVEFCYRYGRFFHGVHWLMANQDLIAEIAACGTEMELQPWPETLPEQAQATLEAWERSGTRLVVLDNVEESQVVQEWLPKMHNCTILITSRQHDWPPDLGLSLLPLEILPRADSLALLRKLARRLDRSSNAELEPIAERLGDLPLALDLAGRYMYDRRILSPAGFLEELEKSGSALKHSALKDWTEHNPTQHETNLAATFTLSWERLESSGMPDVCTSQRLFCASGYCASNTPIPWEVFYSLAADQEQAAVDQNLIILEDSGLLTLTEAGAVVHPLLAEFARLQDGEAEESVLVRLAEAVRDLAIQATDSGLPERYKPLRAHVHSVASHAEERQSKQAGILWNTLGIHLIDVAEYNGAKSAFERALLNDGAFYGPQHPTAAARLNNLGMTSQILGDYAGAKAVFERAITIYEASGDQADPKFATLATNLGLVLRELGDFSASKASLERALSLHENIYGPDHPSIAWDAFNLGRTLMELGDYPAAQAAIERAQQIDEANNGAEHPFVATDINGLGEVRLALGDYSGAQAAFERALRIDEAAFGPEHPDVARDINNLGRVLKELGEGAGARAAFERALVIYEKLLPADHPSTVKVRMYLDELLKSSEKL